MEEKCKLETTYMSLHLMAMAFMFCDHLWGTLMVGHEWLTCIGRLAFPIFAFLIVEGYFHTHNLKKYVLRLMIFAIISELPFNLMMASTVFAPLYQNVIWTFLIGIFMIWLNEKAKKTGKLWVQVLTVIGTLILGFLMGVVGFVDYHFAGVFMVMTFYFFRGNSFWCRLCQLLVLVVINVEIMGGYGYEVTVFGRELFIQQQGFALLALIPIWLYRGRQGPHSKALQYLNYSFYPVHMLILALIQIYR